MKRFRKAAATEAPRVRRPELTLEQCQHVVSKTKPVVSASVHRLHVVDQKLTPVQRSA